ncbi:MAG: helix-turn-helix transcriptional regulator [Planctomycetes bacterium]|nr:helix-turn-helix transcriptional regulator [Planctomycetota bacterium]
MYKLSASGIKQKNPGYIFRSPNHPRLHLSLVLSGEAVLEWGGRRLVAKKGMLFCITPGESITLSSPRTGYTGIHVAIAAEGYDFPIRTGAWRATHEVRLAGQTIWNELQNILEQKVQLLPEMFQLFVGYAFRQLADLDARPGCGSPGDWAESIAAKIRSTLYADISIAEILEGVPLSPRQLRKHFRSEFGCSIKHYQLEHRIAEARRMLKDGSLSITDIACELGFPSSQHFATQFKRMTGMSPREYGA